MRMIFGELDGTRSKRAEQLHALCLKAGFDATLSDQILTELWMKFALLAANAGSWRWRASRSGRCGTIPTCARSCSRPTRRPSMSAAPMA